MAVDSPGLDLFCPKCMYSLRGLSGNRCPECGGEFDRSALMRSRVPWYSRRETGVLRAWWRTCWMAAFRTRELALSTQAPARYAEARRFWLINSTLLSLPWCVLAWFVPVELPGTRTLTSTMGPGVADVPEWLAQNVLIPMQAALCFRPVAAGCAVLSVFLVTGAVSYLFQLMPLPRRLQDRAAALSLFSSGSPIAGGAAAACGGAVLGILWLATLLATGGMRNARIEDGRAIRPVLLMVPLVTGGIWWGSLVLLYRRMCQASAARTAAAIVLVPLVSLAILLLCGVALPWCIGIVRIMLALP